MTRPSGGLLGIDLWPNHEASLWLRNELAALRHLHERVGIRVCTHLADGTADRGCCWLHDRDRLLCPACAARAPDPDAGERWRCDRCDGQFPETLRVAGVLPTNRLTVWFGLCPDCYRREVGP